MTALKNKADDSIPVFLSNLMKNKTFHRLASQKKTLASSVQSVYHNVIDIINTFEASKKLAFYEEHIHNIPNTDWNYLLWNNYMYAAIDQYPSKKFFETFHQPVAHQLISIRYLYNAFTVKKDSGYDFNVKFKDELMDEHWASELYPFFAGKLKWDWDYNMALRIIHHLEKKDKKLNALLTDLTKKVAPNDSVDIFRLLLIREAPKRFETIFSVLEKLPKGTYCWQLNQLSGKNLWNQFPQEYAEKFSKLYDKTQLTLFREIADEIFANVP